MNLQNQPLQILVLVCTLLYPSLESWAGSITPEDVPIALLDWVPWVLHDQDHKQCPYRNDRRQICSWPTLLELRVQSKGAEFQQNWDLHAAGWITLPGSARHWPERVMLDDSPMVVADRKGVPSLWLNKGLHILHGHISWSKRPDALWIPTNTGQLHLVVDGKVIAKPRLDPMAAHAAKKGKRKKAGIAQHRSKLWLQGESQGQAKKELQDRLELRVYRKFTDDIPLRQTTRIELDVSGQNREVILGPVIAADFSPMRLDSPTLPARLEADGRLRLQVRPGKWTISLYSRHQGLTNELPLQALPKPWPQQEIWVFAARIDLRQVDISGVPAIDPQQTGLPKKWRELPTYRLHPGEALKLTERRRGDPDPAPDQLQLERSFWLDFDGSGYTVSDHIHGAMTRGWRMEMPPPGILGRVSVNGKEQFITQRQGQANSGVEVRRGQLDLRAESRLEEARSKLPATGWAKDFQTLKAVLHLPPGWLLFDASGADEVSTTWLQRWSLLDIFLVLIIAIAISRLWSWPWGVLALVLLGLSFHESGAPRWVWLHLLASLALLRLLPPGKFRSIIDMYRNLALLTLLLIAIPFMVQHARLSLYPQLQSYWQLPKERQAVTAMEEQMPANAPVRQLSSKVDHWASKRTQKMEPSRQQALAQFDPQAQIQTGPGVPHWSGQKIHFRWSGPVHREQTLQLVLFSPAVGLFLGLLRIVLLAALVAFLLYAGYRERAPKQTPPTPSAVALLGLVLLLGFGSPTQASEYPSKALLETLQKRLLQAPDCLPTCASVPKMHLQMNKDTLRATLEVHALSPVAIPLPGVANHWLARQVLVDGLPAKTVLRDQGILWVHIEAGIRDIVLQGPFPPNTKLQLDLPPLAHPRRVTLAASQWQVEGLHADGIADPQLHLLPPRKQTAKQGLLEPGTLPPFVLVERTLRLGLEWTVHTRVQRLTPIGSAISLGIPLLPEESVTTAKIRIKAGKVRLNMPSNQRQTHWDSVLPIQPSIFLQAPATQQWQEQWQLDTSTVWHVEWTGIPVIHHQNRLGQWLPQWRPWAGEELRIHVTRPAGITGRNRTIDRVKLHSKPGQRASDHTLEMRIRSSRGGQHALHLPHGASLQSVHINGTEQPIRQNENRVSLPLRPGVQEITLRFQEGRGLEQHWSTPAIDLGSPSVNTHIKLQLPSDRWVLFVGGPDVGPAVLIWSMLLVVILASIGLGRIPITPLRTHHWILLGVVLSQISIALALIVIGWLVALGARKNLSPESSVWRFNLTQIGLGILTLAALSALVLAIHQGLLGHPDMQISGNSSHSTLLQWYEDRNNGTLPQAWIISLPMTIYRIAMLAWALWLAFALLRWFHWGWQCFSSGGLWQQRAKKAKPTAKVQEETAPEAEHYRPPGDK